MIILTGAAGFIGSNLLKALNCSNIDDIVIVEDLINNKNRLENLKGRNFKELISIENFWEWYKTNKNSKIDSIIHLGACSNTLENNMKFLKENIVLFSKKLFNISAEKNIQFIYASSAATYGNGNSGFSDSHEKITDLIPLNPYAVCKNEFDKWVLKKKNITNKWIGLKYFNVFGPGERHKGKMASIIFQFFEQINRGENLKLFDSSHGYDRGCQTRDFIYIDDAINVTLFFLKNLTPSGIYNVGSGKSHSFNQVANYINILFEKNEIEYVPFPKDLIKRYQPKTLADIKKLRSVGYKEKFTNIKDGIKMYKKHYNNF